MNNILFETSCQFNTTELLQATTYLCKIKCENKNALLVKRICNLILFFVFLDILFKIYSLNNPYSGYLELTPPILKTLLLSLFLFIVINFDKPIVKILNLKVLNKIFNFPNKYLFTNTSITAVFYLNETKNKIFIVKFTEIKQIIKFNSNLLAILYNNNQHLFIKLNDDSDLYSSFEEICSSYSLKINETL